MASSLKFFTSIVVRCLILKTPYEPFIFGPIQKGQKEFVQKYGFVFFITTEVDCKMIYSYPLDVGI